VSRVIPEYLRKMISMLQAGLVMTPVCKGLVAFDPEEKTEVAYSKNSVNSIVQLYARIVQLIESLRAGEMHNPHEQDPLSP